MTTLLERTAAGTRIELAWIAGEGSDAILTLTIQEPDTDEGQGRCLYGHIRPSQALEAFNHPYCYVRGG